MVQGTRMAIVWPAMAGETDDDVPVGVQAIRDLSWAVFRRRYALEIGAAIDSLDVFTVAEVTEGLENPPNPSSVQKELSDLREIGLLHEAPKRRSERQKFYRKTACTYWIACVELAEKAKSDELGPPRPITRARPRR